jgi:hypothetical protein
MTDRKAGDFNRGQTAGMHRSTSPEGMPLRQPIVSSIVCR